MNVGYRGFARQPCCMAGTMKIFCIRKNFFSHRKKNLLFLPCKTSIDRTNLANKGFILWLSGTVFLRDTASSPERLHLARSGSQSHRAVWFILLARGASHIIKMVISRLISETRKILYVHGDQNTFHSSVDRVPACPCLEEQI